MSHTRVDLIIWDNGKAIRRRILQDGRYVIGRDGMQDINLPSERISRQHARIHVQGDQVIVEDLRSQNGIYFDGQRVGQHQAKDGDYVFVDPYVLEFQVKPIHRVSWSPPPTVVMRDRKRPVLAQLITEVGGHAHELQANVTTMGRGDDRTVQAMDEAASRAHAEVHRLGSTWVLRDSGSANGTYLNGRRVREASLQDGDRIQIGGTIYRFCIAPAADERLRQAS